MIYTQQRNLTLNRPLQQNILTNVLIPLLQILKPNQRYIKKHFQHLRHVYPKYARKFCMLLLDSLPPSDAIRWQDAYMCKLIIIGSDNGLSPGRRQAVIWTNAEILLIGHLGTYFSENLFEIHSFSFKNMGLQMSAEKCQPFCLGFNVLTWKLHC